MIEEEDDEVTPCPLCGGPLMVLGQMASFPARQFDPRWRRDAPLARITHYRCRNCGMDCSRKDGAQ